MYIVNDNYEVVEAQFDNFEIYLENNHLVVLQKDSNLIEDLYFMEIEKGLDGYSGSIVYTQYDCNKDIRAILTYQQMYNQENLRIYPMHIEVPLSYGLEIKASKNIGRKRLTYMKNEYRYEENPYLCNIITIRDYGLHEFVKNGPLKLQGNNTLIKYDKVLAYTPNKHAISGYLFTK